MDNRGYNSVDEVKKHLHELYNNKIKELELLKARLEGLRRKDEEFLAQESKKLNRQYEQKEKAVKSRYARMEEEFERRVQDKAREIVKDYCDELKRGLDKVKNALVNMESSMVKLIEIRDIKLAEYSESSPVFQDDRDYTGALSFAGNSADMQIEEEFKELLSEQDKRLESIANLINEE